MRRSKPAAKIRVIVQALAEDQEFDLLVEPWGETFRIAPGSQAVVTFIGPDRRQAPEVSTLRGTDYLCLCAEWGLTDYYVEDGKGRRLTGQ